MPSTLTTMRFMSGVNSAVDSDVKLKYWGKKRKAATMTVAAQSMTLFIVMILKRPFAGDAVARGR